MTSTASFSVHPTPIGRALVVVTDEGLARLDVLDDGAEGADGADGAVDAALAAATHALHTVPVHDPRATSAVTAQLDEYFAGARRGFDLALDLRGAAGFGRAALEAIRAIPYGETASYAEVAIAAGSPRAHRAVGTVCAHTPISIVVPAHRVVRADGSIGEYGGHPERKRFLLDLEERVVQRSAAV